MKLLLSSQLIVGQSFAIDRLNNLIKIKPIIRISLTIVISEFHLAKIAAQVLAIRSNLATLASVF